MARNWQLGMSLGKLIHYPDTQATVGQDFAEYCYLCVTIRHWSIMLVYIYLKDKYFEMQDMITSHSLLPSLMSNWQRIAGDRLLMKLCIACICSY